MTANTPSREFFDLIKAIGEAKSKQEEDRIIRNEIRVLKSRMGGLDVSKKQMQEYVIRLLYCELLGHESAFGYIHAVNMCQADNAMQKRIGYLACTLVLNADHELVILLVNTIQQDLKSTNHLKVCAALTACCRLINAETLPAVCDMVINLLDHSREIVRKKAVVALHRFIQINPDLMAQLDERFRRVLCDKDPGVMSAACSVFHFMVQDETTRAGLKDLVPSLVSILKQVVDHRLPREYDYHRVPAPWTQIKLLQILAALGQDDQVTSEGMYGVLEATMRPANNSMSIGYAITYECVRTIARIYPNPTLCETAATYIKNMISSQNQNLKYLGVTGLAELVKVSPKYAAQHQLAVLDCLEDPDDSLKRKTLDLLYRMTSPQNVLVITGKLLAYLKHTSDPYLREELVSRVTLLAERYAPDNEWFINTMNTVFELGGELVRPETAHNLVRLIAEGSGDDEELDNQLRHHAVLAYLDLLSKKSLPDILLKTIAWVVGEYAYLAVESEDWTVPEIEERLCKLMERQYISVDTRKWGISALTKLIASAGGRASPHTVALVRRFRESADTDLQERCFELELLIQRADTMTAVLPLDASCEDIEVDSTLSFLSWYVDEALAAGASPYLDEDEREDLEMEVKAVGQKDHTSGVKLKMTAYAAPQERAPITVPPVPHREDTASGAVATTATTDGDAGAGAGAAPSLEALVPSSKRKWGKGGYKGKNAATAATTSTVGSGESQSQSHHSADMDLDVTPDFGGGGYSGDSAGESKSASKSASASAHAPEPEPVPRQLTEREKLAASLFGGDAPDGGAGPSPSRRGRGRGRASRSRKVEAAKTAVAPAPAPAPGPSATGSLVDGFEVDSAPTSAHAHAAPAPAPAPVPQKSDIDLLGDIFGGVSAPQAPAPAPARGSAPATRTQTQRQGMGMGMAMDDDLLGMGSMGAAHTAASPGQGHGQNLVDDLLSPMSMSMGGGQVGKASRMNLPQPIAGAEPTQMPATPLIAEVVGDAQCVPASGSQIVASDRTIAVTQVKAYCADQLCVVLSVFNQGSGDLAAVSVKVTAPPELRLDYTSDPDPESQEVTTATWRSLPAQCRVMHAIRLSCAPLAPSGLKVFVSYRDEMRNTRSTSHTVSLTVGDMVRPHPSLSTSEFSVQWPSFKAERRVRVSGSSLTVAAEYASRLEARCHLRVIEAIGSEIIAAGVLAGTEEVCLVHGNVSGSDRRLIVVTVRSRQRKFTDTLTQFLQQVLA